MSNVVPADRALPSKSNVASELNKLVAKYKPLDFGEVSPDFLITRRVLEHLHDVAQADYTPFVHQYTRSGAHPRLATALGNLLTNRFRHDSGVSGSVPTDLLGHTFTAERSINPQMEIITSVGAYGALSTAFSALVNPGDEVLVLEPAFDYISTQIEAIGGVYVCVPMIPPTNTATCVDSSEFAIDWNNLESKITKKTKLLVVNSSNPVGKVLQVEELKRLADICISHNLLCISDEVFEWFVFPPFKHHKIASFPGMWERTVTIGSAGKTFGITGWRVGWSVGPQRLITAMQLIQQNTIFVVCTPLQEALARTIEEVLPTLGTEDCFFRRWTLHLAAKRDRISSALSAIGMRPVKPQAGFFMLSDISHMSALDKPEDAPEKPRDVIFNEWMVVNKGLSGTPSSAFCCERHRSLGENFLQFSIIQDDAKIAKLEECLKKW